LIQRKVIPVINENDSVSTEEIEFGDNDQLSALVAACFNADCVILLSDSDGFYADYKRGRETRISQASDVDAEMFTAVRDVKKAHTKGGMASKLGAIQKAHKAGIPCLLADGHQKHVIRDIFEGEDIGTFFIPRLKKMNSRIKIKFFPFFMINKNWKLCFSQILFPN